MTPYEFMECDLCRAMPGSPTLCTGCVNNRRTISALSGKLQIQKGIYDKISRLEKVWEAAIECDIGQSLDCPSDWISVPKWAWKRLIAALHDAAQGG